MLGRSFNVSGKVIGSSLKVLPVAYLAINGMPINPSSRDCSKAMIQTGISAVNTMNTIARGQKIPIFSAANLPHTKVTAQVAWQASLSSSRTSKVLTKRTLPLSLGPWGWTWRHPASSAPTSRRAGDAKYSAVPQPGE